MKRPARILGPVAAILTVTMSSACANSPKPAYALEESEISGEDFIATYSPAPNSMYRVCRSSSVPQGTRLGGVKYVLGHEEMFGLGDEDNCAIAILAGTDELSLPIRTQIFQCHLAAQAEFGIVSRIQLAVPEPTESQLQKCFFRVGLWAIGRSEHVLTPDSDLFIPLNETRWWGLPGMPQMIPNISLPNSRRERPQSQGQPNDLN